MDKLLRKLRADFTLSGRRALIDWHLEHGTENTPEGRKARAELCLLEAYTKGMANHFKVNIGNLEITFRKCKKVVFFESFLSGERVGPLCGKLMLGHPDTERYLKRRILYDLKFLRERKDHLLSINTLKELKNYLP